jgi:hypothetical protein
MQRLSLRRWRASDEESYRCNSEDVTADDMSERCSEKNEQKPNGFRTSAVTVTRGATGVTGCYTGGRGELFPEENREMQYFAILR